MGTHVGHSTRGLVTTLGLVAVMSLGSAQAQPAPPETAPTAPAGDSRKADFARAAEFYHRAEAHTAEGKFAEAASDYGLAYEITKDPLLFYKLGASFERLGNCTAARAYFGRYLREAKPTEEYRKLAEGKLAACGEPNAGGKATPSPATPAVDEVAERVPLDQPSPPPVSKTAAQRGATAWWLLGGSAALLATGGVLMIAANSTESELSDLYRVEAGGAAPVYDDAMAARFDRLETRGQRYQIGSWTAFGVGGALGVAAAYWFWRDRSATEAPRAAVVPVLSPQGLGLSAQLAF